MAKHTSAWYVTAQHRKPRTVQVEWPTRHQHGTSQNSTRKHSTARSCVLLMLEIHQYLHSSCLHPVHCSRSQRKFRCMCLGGRLLAHSWNACSDVSTYVFCIACCRCDSTAYPACISLLVLEPTAGSSVGSTHCSYFVSLSRWLVSHSLSPAQQTCKHRFILCVCNALHHDALLATM